MLAALVAAVTLLHVLTVIAAAPHHSITFDEDVHLTGGYVYWTRNDYRVNPEAGNLPQRVAGFASTLLPTQFVPSDDPDWIACRDRRLAQHLLFGLSNSTDTMVVAGRAGMAMLGGVLVLAVFFIARSLWGVRGGLVAMFMAALSPTVLAHAGLMTSDLAAALGFALAIATLWRLLHRVTPGTLVAASLAAGVLALSKMSGPLLAPMAAVLWVVRVAVNRPLVMRWGERRAVLRARAGQGAALMAVLAGQLLLVTLIIWLAYGCRFSAFAPDQLPGQWPTSLTTMLDARPGIVRDTLAAMHDHKLLPEAFIRGLAFVRHHAQVRPAFLHGEHSPTGFAWFFPVALAIKTALGEWLLLLGALACGIMAMLHSPRRWRMLYRVTPWLTLIVVYGGVAIASGVNIGHRHLLPLYPALFVLAGGIVARGASSARWRHGLAAGALVLLAIESAMVWPHHLSFFNAAIGGPRQGHRWLVDSSLDWGQDLPALKRYLDAQQASEPQVPRYFAYFGVDSPNRFRIPARWIGGYGTRDVFQLRPQRLAGGVYCISATVLQHVLGESTSGPWRDELERQYQALRQLLSRYDHGQEDFNEVWAAIAADHGAPRTASFLSLYRRLRLARLCAYLRQREPDDWIGYSILVYRLTDADVNAALHGPSPAR